MRTTNWTKIYSTELDKYLVIAGKDIEGKELLRIPLFQSELAYDSLIMLKKAISLKLFEDTGMVFQLSDHVWSTRGKDELFLNYVEFESGQIFNIKTYVDLSRFLMPLKQTMWIDSYKYQKLFEKQVAKELQ